MKTLKTTVIAAILFLSVLFGATSASLTSDDLAIQVHLSNDPVNAGSTITVTVTLTNYYSKDISVSAVGFHADWMDSSSFYGSNFSNYPTTIARGHSDTFTITVDIPSTLSKGAHTYYVGVDGSDSSGYSFSIDSETLLMQATRDTQNSQSANPTAHPTPPAITTLPPIHSNPTPTVVDDSLFSESNYTILAVIGIVGIVVVVVAVVAVFFIRHDR
jgi:hypothetical protein